MACCSISEFVQSALQGVGIAMSIVFLVLIISTRYCIVAIFATIDIVGIMACILALIDLYEWQFGISESISAVIIISFSFDYVVHVANTYLESIAEKRKDRLSFSLLTMGVSVASGAVTTFLSGFFMRFPEMQFFHKIGVILATIIWNKYEHFCNGLSIRTRMNHNEKHIFTNENRSTIQLYNKHQ